MDATNPSVSISDGDRDIAIRTMLGEEGSPDGMAGVAATMLNRAQSGQYGGRDLTSVALAPGQFEPWSARASDLMAIRRDDPQYIRAGEILDGVASGKIPDLTNGATHFYAPGAQRALGRNNPAWAQGQGTGLGKTMFYAPKGAVHYVPPAAKAIQDATAGNNGGAVTAATTVPKVTGSVTEAPIAAYDPAKDPLLSRYLKPAPAGSSAGGAPASPAGEPAAAYDAASDPIIGKYLKAVPAAPKAAPAPPETPIGVNDTIRATATGVPILGGLLNKADAGTNALLAPVLNRFFSPENQLQGDTLGERYNNALAQQNKMDEGFAAAHPIANTVANVAGAVGGTIPAMMAAPGAFGVGGGGLISNALAGGASGAAINAADSGIRNGFTTGNVGSGAVTGLLGGAAGPIVGKVIGAGVEGISNLLSRGSSGARNVADILTHQMGMTPEAAQQAVSKLGPYGTLADIDPALTTEASGVASLGGKPTSILKNAYIARAKAADDRLGHIVNDTLGPAPDAVGMLNEIRNRVVSSQVGPEVVRAALDNSMGSAADPHQVLTSMIADRSAAAQPLYEKAMQGGSMAPLESQFEKSFGEATDRVSQAQKDLATAKSQQTLAAAKSSQAGDNVYANSAAGREGSGADAATSQAQKALDAANAEKEAIRARLQRAQADGTANAPGAVWNPRIQQFLDDPIVQPAIAKGVRIQRLEALAEGKPFNPTEYAITGTDESGNPIVGSVPNMRTLNVVKKGLDSMVQDAQDPITGKLSEEGRAIDGVRRSFLAELDKVNPDYAGARQAWAGPSQAHEAFNKGLNIFRNQSGSSGVNTTPGAFQSFMKTASEGEKAAAKLGARSAFQQQMATVSDPASKAAAITNKEANLQKLSAVLGSDEANSLAKQLSFKYEDPVGSAFEKGLAVFQNRGGVQGIEDSPAALRSWMKTASPEEIAAHQQGARQAIDQSLNAARQGDLSQARSLFAKSTANRQKLEAIFPNAGKMLDSLDSELAMRQNGNAIVSGAQTAERRAVQNKYTPTSSPGMGAAVPLLGEAIAGGPGAAAAIGAKATASAIKNAFTTASRNRLIEQTARGLSAIGPEQNEFMGQVGRVYKTLPTTRAATLAGNVGANLLARTVAQRNQKLFPNVDGSPLINMLSGPRT